MYSTTSSTYDVRKSHARRNRRHARTTRHKQVARPNPTSRKKQKLISCPATMFRFGKTRGTRKSVELLTELREGDKDEGINE